MHNKIGIFGVPRSGTSWLGQIFNSSEETSYFFQPMFTEVFRDKINARSSKEEMETYFRIIYESKKDFLFQNDRKVKEITKLSFPKNSTKNNTFVFKETMYLYMIPHFLRNLSEMKIILILRNPYAVLKSWYNAPKEFYPEWNIQEEWMFAQRKNWFLPERYYGYHKWKEAIALATALESEFSQRVFCVKYEDLDAEPYAVIRQLFEFAGISYEKQTEKFIKDSRSRTEISPYSVFRNPNDRTNNTKKIPANIVDQIAYDLKNFSMINEWYTSEEMENYRKQSQK